MIIVEQHVICGAYLAVMGCCHKALLKLLINGGQHSRASVHVQPVSALGVLQKGGHDHQLYCSRCVDIQLPFIAKAQLGPQCQPCNDSTCSAICLEP